MHFREVIAVLARRACVADVQQAVRVAFGRGVSVWVAEHAGIAPRTARRWLSTSPPKRRLDSILTLAHDLPDAVAEVFADGDVVPFVALALCAVETVMCALPLRRFGQ